MQMTSLLEHIAQVGDSWLAAVFNALAGAAARPERLIRQSIPVALLAL
jgi:hypothetical protein